CKSEKGPGFARLVDMVIEQWKVHGEPHHGPLWVLSTDGDSVFREGTFRVLMCEVVDASNPLYSRLSGLQGLNLQCGKGNVVTGPDPKHITKR
ncbi:hypothetical protein B0H10DRAFT_1636485, partial [Mycena sp. CBHHK59/15]